MTRRITMLGLLLAVGLAAPALAQPSGPEYPHGEFEAECSLCHDAERWSPARIPADFDHGELSEFELEGSHRKALCRSCHLTLDFAQAEPDCASCHRDVHNGELGPDCSVCHSTTSFIDRAEEMRSHRLTRFPLTGAHGGLDCVSCHRPQPQGGLQFVNTPVECVACHRTDFQATTDPNHAALGFDEDCTRCHATTAWETARFDHDATGFPLTGGHATLSCESCHAGGQFSGTPAQCFSCHQTDYESTTNPDHAAGGLPTECQQCHATTSWSGAAFNHVSTGFPLDGGHVGLECRSCHAGGNFSGADGRCVACHQADYQQAPNHVSASYPTDCQSCHTTATWQGAQFQHEFFPLTGGHAGPDCVQCHTSGSFGPIPSDCVGCHRSDYDQAPGHVSSSFPQTCESCHTINTWTGATFDHASFPITGAHVPLTCQQCHTSGTYGPVPGDCVDCHQADYTSAPSHVAGSFPQTCEDCHTTSTFAGGTFDHGFFPLQGAHAAVDCVSCHTSGVFQPIPNGCIDCHQSDYNQAPSHAGSGFPTTCDDCHSNNTWTGATFDHASFPITGAHVPLTCQQCHTSGTYGPMPSDCVFCHQADYVSAPSHVASNFPQTCESCHTTSTFAGGTFDHAFFPLQGAHATLECVSCHTTGIYQPIPSDCVDCHQADYNQAPGHVTSNFPTTCDSCHSSSTWLGASFDHAFFPLSGGHNGLECVSCHTSGQFAPIPSDCFSCHQPDYQGAPDHVALQFPTDCEQCHDVTNWFDDHFIHSFPLSGPHDRSCTSCHVTGTVQEFSCYGTCHEHSVQSTTSHHTDVNGFVYDFQACLACHPNGRH